MTNEREHMSSCEGGGGWGGAHHDGGDKAPSRCILCQKGRGDILPLQLQGLLALRLTGHDSLQEWLVTITALSTVQAGLPFVHYGFSVEKMFKPPERGFSAGAIG